MNYHKKTNKLASLSHTCTHGSLNYTRERLLIKMLVCQFDDVESSIKR